MKTYSKTMADVMTNRNNPNFHEAPERTAYQAKDFGYYFQVWTNRPAMAKSIRMQQKRARSGYDWIPVMPLNDAEGF